ncbi:nucleotidyl transferase AbiEii/AbiGii toxin family protein [Kitasatospora sp. NPDC004615]|uniref:nucleotidyl transferase AbiEii/AbiGii toxin family protein n=1 Tax=Kitasatospora sp. NPDC004615 TaxID=3364017 RepID=UPI003687814B
MSDPRMLPQARDNWPRTFLTIDDPRATQAEIYDPALIQFANAYRAGDPQFTDPALSAAWYAARRTAMDTVLAAVAASGRSDHLVLRGSVALKAWFGDAAREPGDLDFVITPADWMLDDPRTEDLFDDLTRTVAASTGPVRFLPERTVSEDIWTYERAPGRRLLFSWETDGLPGGTVQLDFVFNEELPVPAEPLEVAPGTVLNVAGRELSLAWKLLWLATDSDPQGKDLYDAALLAGSTRLRYQVLRDVFATGLAYYAEHPIGLDDVLTETDWPNFATEYPRLAGEESDHTRRLADALAPTFAEVPAAELAAWWREGWLAPVRRLHAEQGLAATQSWLADRQATLPLAYRLTAEALGAAAPEHLGAAMLGCPTWAGHAGSAARGSLDPETVEAWLRG